MPAPSASALIDWVDEADRPISAIERGLVFERSAKFRVVHVFVFNRRGDLLLQQLGRSRERNPLKWGSSVAGYLYAGESYVEGATRRLKEELGLETPLVKNGSISMQDLSCTKFITLYETYSEHPVIQEPSHIESIKFWSIGEIDTAIRKEPDILTETFRYVFGFYRAALALRKTV